MVIGREGMETRVGFQTEYRDKSCLAPMTVRNVIGIGEKAFEQDAQSMIDTLKIDGRRNHV